MTSRGPRVQQWKAVQDRDNLALIPPLAEEFSAYGGSETTERARTWALAGRYLLATGIPACAHGLYLLASCPKNDTCRNNFRQLDHANIWVPAHPEDGHRPFLLAHPYASGVSNETRTYAKAHGLILEPGRPGDDWYGHDTLPISMMLADNWPVWPIEAKAAVLLATQPVLWPEDPCSGEGYP